MMSFGVKSVNGWVIGVGGSNAGLSGRLLRIARESMVLIALDFVGPMR
jgi:hypothetical protein